MTPSEEIKDLNDNEDQALANDELKQVSGGARRFKQNIKNIFAKGKLGAQSTKDTPSRTKITTDEVGDVDQ